ncbi:S-adenosylmethionine:tRNA ribosyltransferase-isomerase [Labilibaculum euxinus]|uniref:S-adenosylmethionine:tRNA ribosyltransferase-isomerase n=1 Tax=Labilibaculum euxinus TaxID=2686357 RepID=A0A7M4D8N4_9BACT|nr:S-adenosylmethionine:tRNA ribosyltransferase-isomerase [Labilibaculum euxinus]MUP39013.1 S-adenosylmethionine:tRNA ribosyltransferase-isomerase [Labilibaculum euxinus]MVB08218.1 S-adenosylmethionine:tRNA ribosyltransferase-isomerase [Labilibaculum euxinus]
MDCNININSLDAKQIQISDFTYDLPDQRIAKHPLANRDLSKLLIYKNGLISESVFENLPSEIASGTTMVFNNTKVIQARLIFHKETGARIEIFCLEPLKPADYNLAFQACGSSSWKCIVGNARKWKSGMLKMPFYVDDKEYFLKAEKQEALEGAQEIFFSWNHPDLSFSEVLEQTGKIPIPPYLNRDTEATDLLRYQTVYSKYEGSVAAPTAGLHFTEDVFSRLKAKKINREELTLHVGAGTFKPVKSEQIGDHEMHTEHIQVTLESLQNIIKLSGQIIAVGTTSVRSLESLYWMGVKILTQEENPHLLKQWEAYQLPANYSRQESYQAICSYMQENGLTLFNVATQIIIAPGYKFKVISGLVTNFHQPQSTLLLLISALVGDNWREIYQYALDNDFRFLSYGDSSLLMRG